MQLMIPPWQKRRSTFNHDWLKNRFMPAIAAFLNLLDDLIENNELEQSFVSSVLPGWEAHRGEALVLARDLERELSPQCLFERSPLSRCDKDTKQWLENLTHSLWLTRYPIKQWVANVCTCIKDTDVAYRLLQEKLQDCVDVRSAQALRPFREQFVEFRERCQDLARAIEKLPSEVRVT